MRGRIVGVGFDLDNSPAPYLATDPMADGTAEQPARDGYRRACQRSAVQAVSHAPHI
jgi:hypothetical protein